MPKRFEDALKRSAKRQGIEPGTDRWNRYVYGSLEKAAKRGDIPKDEAPGAKEE